MKICVLGAGVIGVSTAYMLARQGHDVSVIDKGMDVASGASHANGAQLSYSYVDPFASPSALRKLPAYLAGIDPAIKFGVSLKADYLKWGVSFLSECTSKRYLKNLQARTALAALSCETMSLIESDLATAAIARTGVGKIVLASTAAEYEQMKKTSAGRADQTCLNIDECIAVEPSLSSWSKAIYGGLFAKDDSALDPTVYCQTLKTALVDNFDATFHFGQTIQDIQTASHNQIIIKTDRADHSCEAVVICLGNDPRKLLKKLDMSLPIYPMQGYSLTLNAIGTSPKTSITDLQNKIVFANLGDKIRIAGFLDANQNPNGAKARGQQLLKIAREVWPNAADFDGPVQHWTHFRPMMPSGVPVIGATKIPGVYVNVGHGSLGYTFAAGSAMKIAKDIGHAFKNSHTQMRRAQ
ncbi:FAD-dependent oxidoreductase [Fretibacter rubidus]|uniref:FAD-dependent oxidoreductase n=1 Tax=Fretibacter rubidus TaxID=570162 RepID=UPI00352AB62F